MCSFGFKAPVLEAAYIIRVFCGFLAFQAHTDTVPHSRNQMLAPTFFSILLFTIHSLLRDMI